MATAKALVEYGFSRVVMRVWGTHWDLSMNQEWKVVALDEGPYPDDRPGATPTKCESTQQNRGIRDYHDRAAALPPQSRSPPPPVVVSVSTPMTSTIPRKAVAGRYAVMSATATEPVLNAQSRAAWAGQRCHAPMAGAWSPTTDRWWTFLSRR
ncbi:MAG: hypothetical protein JWN03_1066 [Nocardia sp.]|nr:hypothetical protein [Nocardia sp.]